MPTLLYRQHGICIIEEIKAAAIGHHPYDVVLVCAANEKLLAHKLILAAASPLLKMILEDTSVPNEIITTIHFPDVPAHFFRMLLNLLYSGEVSMSPCEVEKINNLLLLLQMCDLIKFHISINDSSKAVNSFTQSNVQLPQLSRCDASYPHVKLERLDDDYIEIVGQNQMGSVDFNSSETQTLKRLLLLPANVSTNDKGRVSNYFDCDIVSPSKNQTSDKDILAGRKYKCKPFKKKFQCKICPKKFNFQSHLKSHMIVHTGERPFECQLCFVKFSVKNNLFRHISSKHQRRPESAEEEYTCSFCSRGFKTQPKMVKHLRSAHDHLCVETQNLSIKNRVKPDKNSVRFLCELCKEKFKQKSHLYHHFYAKHQDKIIISATPNLYNCFFCSLLFESKEFLNLHLGQKHYNLLLC